MKVLVTGGAGFVGSHTVDVLLEEGHDVTVLDNLDRQVHRQVDGYPVNLSVHATKRGLRLMRGDVRDRPALLEALAEVEGVLHLAASVGVGQSMYQPFNYCSVNVGGTAQLLDLLANERTRVQKVVVASSMSIYGEGAYSCEACGRVYPVSRDARDLVSGNWEVRCPSCGRFARAVSTEEDKPLVPTSIYAITKQTQEELVLCFGEAYKLPVVALRYFNIYGPRQSLSNPYTGVVAIFLSRLLNRKPPVIFEDGMQSRDFIHVRDVARANVLALTSSAANYRALNVGSGASTTVLEVFRQLSRILNVSIEPTFARRYRAGDIRHCFSDSSLAASLLAWKPRVTLDEGLTELVEWSLKSGPDARDLVDVAYSELERKNLLQ
jgi:dTDP-L-rhamnose 4-epimerase